MNHVESQILATEDVTELRIWQRKELKVWWPQLHKHGQIWVTDGQFKYTIDQQEQPVRHMERLEWYTGNENFYWWMSYYFFWKFYLFPIKETTWTYTNRLCWYRTYTTKNLYLFWCTEKIAALTCTVHVYMYIQCTHVWIVT